MQNAECRMQNEAVSLLYNAVYGGRLFESEGIYKRRCAFEETHLKHTAQLLHISGTSFDSLCTLCGICEKEGFKKGFNAAAAVLNSSKTVNIKRLYKSYLSSECVFDAHVLDAYNEFCKRYKNEVGKLPDMQCMTELEELLDEIINNSFFIGCRTAEAVKSTMGGIMCFILGEGKTRSKSFIKV